MSSESFDAMERLTQSMEKETSQLEQNMNDLIDEQKSLIKEETDVIEIIENKLLPLEDRLEHLEAKADQTTLDDEEMKELAKDARAFLEVHMQVLKEVNDISNKIEREGKEVSTVGDIEADLDGKIAELEQQYMSFLGNSGGFVTHDNEIERELNNMPTPEELRESIGLEN